MTLVIGGTPVEMLASYTPSDPIRQLIAALFSATRGDPATVWWHLEPDGYFLHFQPDGAQLRLQLDFAHDSDRKRSRRVLSYECGLRQALLPFWRFIRRFQSEEPHAPHWPEVDYCDLDAIAHFIKTTRPQDGLPREKEPG